MLVCQNLFKESPVVLTFGKVLTCVINAPEFAQACAEKLLANIAKAKAA
jgi:hypothetical protein